MSKSVPLDTLPLFASPAPERARAASVLDQMAEERRAWLARMRSCLCDIYEARVVTHGQDRAYVTADDARSLMARAPMWYGLPAGASPNLLGALFRAPGWQAIDRGHVSRTPGSHGNDLVRWRWVGARANPTEAA